jgi:Flp pilus assembly protein TadG
MREQRGSVLMLMPAAVLVFLVLGALCVDFGGTFSAKRELSNAAAAAANDVASQAIDLDRFYGSGELRLRADVARRVAERSVAAMGLERLDAAVDEVVVGPDRRTVTVTLRGRARYLFAKAVPGGPEGMDVTASSTAHAAEL